MWSQPGLCVITSSAVWYFCPSTFLQCQELCTGRVLLPQCLFQQHETHVCPCETVIAPQPFRCLLSAPWDLVSTASYSLSFHLLFTLDFFFKLDTVFNFLIYGFSNILLNGVCCEWLTTVSDSF